VCALVEPGERVLVLGGPGLCAALEAHGARPTPTTAVDPGPLVRRAGQPGGAAGDRPFDAVVVGLTREFGYRDLDAAAAAVRCGARLLASNADTTFPGADGLHPGCGSLVAAVEAASGRTASVAGKPHGPMVELLRSRLGMAPAQPEVVVVGDRGDTDGRLAQALGVPFLLVLSGVTARADLPLDVPVARVGEDLAELVLPDPAGGPPR
jgi:4-nitrophenyl phosphatase